jgi:hypothetical protein
MTNQTPVPRRRRLWLLITLILAVLLIGAGVIFLPNALTGKQAEAASSPSPTSTFKLKDQDQGNAVAKAVLQLNTNPKDAFTKATLKSIGNNVDSALPKGSKVATNPKAWEPDGVGGGLIPVEIKVPGSDKIQYYIAFMVRENGAWKISQTMPAEAQK